MLTTARLFLRPLSTDDAQSFYDLNDDPEVMQYTGDKAFESVEAAYQFLAQYDQYKKYRVGRFAVIRRDDDTFLGWCGLRYDAQNDEYDMGFRFFKRFWGQGYASEAAKACLTYGFDELSLPYIVGRAMKENLASIRVLEKIGLVYERDAVCGEAAGVRYVIMRS
jgi:[ribosomal protein S5]-alanine N-acetyltransferase